MRTADGFNVHDIFEIANVGQHEILLMCGGSSNGFVERNALHGLISIAQKIIRAVLHPARHVSVRWAAVGRVVLEATILWRIVGWSDDDAVGKVLFSPTVINQDGARDDWSRGYPIVFLNDRFDTICSEYFKRGALCRA